MNHSWERLGRVLFWLSWPALRIYLRIGARTRVVIVAENQVLLVKGWLSDDSWHLPGGGLHRHEDPVAGAVREVHEETGIALEPQHMKVLEAGWYTDHGFRTYLHFFGTTLDHALPPHRQRGEIIAAQWIRLDELQNVPIQPEVQHGLDLLSHQG